MQQKTANNILWYGECSCLQHCKHLYSWWRIEQTIGIPLEIQKISQWNRCSTYLRNCYPNNQMRYMEWKQLTGKLFMEVFVFHWWWTCHQSLAHKSTYFQILYCVLERWTRTLDQTLHRNKDWRGSKVHRNTEPWMELIVSQLNSSGISSQDSPRCSSATKFKIYCWDWVKHQRILQDGLSSCRCSTISHGDQETMKKNASQMLNSFLYLQKKDLEQDNGHSSDLDQRKKWYCISADSPQGEWDRMAEKMLEFGESGHPVFRATSPLSRGRLKKQKWLSIHYGADLETIYNCSSHTYFCKTAQSLRSSRRNVWKNESYHDRTGRQVVGGQSSSSFVPSVIKTNVPLNNDDPLHIRISIAKMQRTNWTVITTRQSEQILYGCTIPDYCWNRTVFHDERHWRIFTFHRFSGLSWVHLAKRGRYI